MVPAILKKAFGLLPQEYVCVALEDMQDHPSVFMTAKGSAAWIDVTKSHMVLGYKPLLIGIWTGETDSELADALQVCLSFTGGAFKAGKDWRGFNTAANCIARLELTRLNHELKLPGLAIFSGDFGEHSFLPAHQEWANRLADRVRSKPNSDANLAGNLYEQVRIAYCIPRTISVITVKDNDLLNFFPTDLHGAVGSDHYLSSLRIGGMACGQVENVDRIVISRVDVDSFRQTYALGKNHMKSLQPADNFKVAQLSSQSGIPVYPNATDYLELEREGQMDAGIHRMFSYKVVGRGQVRKSKALAHIHRYYAQWRINHDRSAEYFYH